MPNRVTIREGQSIWDVALQEFGTIEPARAILALNGYVIGQDIPVGTLLDLPPVDGSDERVQLVKALGVEPATGDLSLSPSPTGAFSSGFSTGFA